MRQGIATFGPWAGASGENSFQRHSLLPPRVRKVLARRLMNAGVPGYTLIKHEGSSLAPESLTVRENDLDSQDGKDRLESKVGNLVNTEVVPHY